MQHLHHALALVLVPWLAGPGVGATQAAESPTPQEEDAGLALDEQEIRPGTWIRHVGEPPTPENLRGRCVVLLFFGPDDLKPAVNWALIQSLALEFEGRVTTLGIFTGSASAAIRAIEKHNLFFPIGVDTEFAERFGVGAASAHLLLDREGAVFWNGPLGGLWGGKITKAMRGSKQVHAEGVLFVHVARPFEGRLERIRGRMESGDLGKAWKDLEALRADERADANQREGAGYLVRCIERHATLVLEQAEAEAARGEAMLAVTGLETLGRELRSTPLGARFAERLEALEKDAEFQRELEADKDFRALYRAFWKRAPSKSATKIARFIEKYEGTRAAAKARVLARI